MYLDYFYKKNEGNMIKQIFENQLKVDKEDFLIVIEGLVPATGENNAFCDMLTLFNKLMLPVFVIPHCKEREYVAFRKRYPFVIMGTFIPVNGGTEEKGIATVAVMEQLSRTLDERKKKKAV